jgi:YebC/PmpR family DNA-binding regulatory protein
MSGHSKWHSIRHKKAANDAARGKVLTKHAKILMVIGRNDPCPETNKPLKNAIANAKSDGVPKTNIEKILKKLAGGHDDGVIYSDLVYEGFAPGGVPVVITSLTDNTNRAYTDIRTAVMKNGGTLGSSGSVMFLFDHVGVITIKNDNKSEDEIFELVIEAGAENFEYEKDESIIFTNFSDLGKVRDALAENLEVLKAEPQYKAKDPIKIDNEEDLAKIEKFIDAVEDVEDTNDVYLGFT